MSKLEELQDRYLRALHAVQTGVAYHLEKDPKGGTPKHLRVGVNSAMVSHGALVELLISKGVITHEEYWEAMVVAMEAEVKEYEDLLSDLLGGASIKLL